MRFLRDAQIKNKTVLLRVDFNVNLKDGRVLEDFRMRATLPTIEYLFEKNAGRIVIISHLGRPKGRNNNKLSLRPVARHLSELLGERASFIEDCVGEGVRTEIEESSARVILLENLRFYKGEESNDNNFSKKLASLGDFFVQDAFGACHRKHASIVGVPNILPSYAGLLVEKEVVMLSSVLPARGGSAASNVAGTFDGAVLGGRNPERPLAALIGGAKVSTKIRVIEKFLGIADNICLGGALANTALKAGGMAVGKSLVEGGIEKQIKRISFTDTALHLPVDVKIAKDKDASDGVSTKGAGSVRDDEIILDIGPDTQKLFSNIIHKSKTIIWNGPMGYIENPAFREGTYTIIREMAKATKEGAFTLVGGGDSYLMLGELGFMDDMSFVSTGGGAMLDFLADGTLPGIEALK